MDPEVSEIGVKWFESAYYFFHKKRGDGKLLGKHALWPFDFSHIKKAFFLHIAVSNPVGTAYRGNLMKVHQLVSQIFAIDLKEISLVSMTQAMMHLR